jgi:hypothetical protein
MTAPKVVVVNGSRRRQHYDPLVENDAKLFQELLRCCHAGSLRERLRAFWRVVALARNRTHPSISKVHEEPS